MSAENQTPTTGGQTSAGLTDADLKHHSQELGLLGKAFGSKEHAAANIVGVAILLSFLLLGAVLFFGPDSTAFPKYEAATLFGTIITGGLGFLFGRSSG